VDGGTFNDYLQQRVLPALNMVRTTVSIPPRDPGYQSLYIASRCHTTANDMLSYANRLMQAYNRKRVADSPFDFKLVRGQFHDMHCRDVDVKTEDKAEHRSPHFKFYTLPGVVDFGDAQQEGSTPMPMILPPAGKADVVVCGFTKTVGQSRSTLLLVPSEQIAVVVMTDTAGRPGTWDRIASMVLKGILGPPNTESSSALGTGGGGAQGN